MAGNKWYVVFVGREPGIYDNWPLAQAQVDNFPGAVYRGFKSKVEATMAYRQATTADDAQDIARILTGAITKITGKPGCSYKDFPQIEQTAWAVDASCPGNPGPMEYQCIDLATGKRVFHYGPVAGGTNNIGEFLAIVHALALQYQRGICHTIYSDSKTAMAWVRKRHANTAIKPNAANTAVLDLIQRAEKWLLEHPIQPSIRKWDTDTWGEIPADFGRK